MALTTPDLDVGLPRSQVGSSPQHLIVTLLFEYWHGRATHLPSAALVALAGDFGVSATSARAALSRLARRGLLDSSKEGRNTFYGLTPAASEVLREDLARIMPLGRDERSWDGSWTVVMFSLSEDRRDVRHHLRSNLRWRGFAPLFDGVWVSPRSEASEAAHVLDELGIDNSTILASRVVKSTGNGDPLAAWDLPVLADAFRDFTAEFTPVRDRIERGAISVAEALVLRSRVLDVWGEFPNLDPGLPDDALPAGWPRADARRTFADVYDGLGPIAVLRFRQVVEQYASNLESPTYFTSSDERLAIGGTR